MVPGLVLVELVTGHRTLQPTHYTTEAVPESASKRLKCKHCDWHEQGVKLDRFEGHMRASHGNLLAPPKESIHKFVRPVDSTDLEKKWRRWQL